jgi:hypothetical protein
MTLHRSVYPPKPAKTEAVTRSDYADVVILLLLKSGLSADDSQIGMPESAFSPFLTQNQPFPASLS